MIQNILMTTDFSTCSQTAAGMAFEMAKSCGATSHLLHVTPMQREMSDFFSRGVYDETEILMEPETRIEQGMNTMLHDYDINPEQVYKVQVRGNSETGSIISYARENPIDLMVMGAHGRSVGGRMLGSVARELIDAAPCPVMLTREKTNENGRFKKILVPVDFAGINPAVVSRACVLAGSLGGTLQLLQVVADPERVVEALMVTSSAQAAIADTVPANVSVEIGVVAGDPAAVIGQFAAEHNTDLIYIPRSEHDVSFINRVTEGVLAGSGCPVCVGPAY